jgi:hypothetical protein
MRNYSLLANRLIFWRVKSSWILQKSPSTVVLRAIAILMAVSTSGRASPLSYLLIWHCEALARVASSRTRVASSLWDKGGLWRARMTLMAFGLGGRSIGVSR